MTQHVVVVDNTTDDNSMTYSDVDSGVIKVELEDRDGVDEIRVLMDEEETMLMEQDINIDMINTDYWLKFKNSDIQVGGTVTSWFVMTAICVVTCLFVYKQIRLNRQLKEQLETTTKQLSDITLIIANQEARFMNNGLEGRMTECEKKMTDLTAKVDRTTRSNMP